MFLVAISVSTLDLAGCGKEEAAAIQSGGGVPSDWLTLSLDEMKFPYQGGTASRDYSLADGISIDEITLSMSNKGDQWCTPVLQDGKLDVRVEQSWSDKERVTVLTIRLDNSHRRTLTIRQDAAPSSDDVKIKVVGGSATSEETVKDYCPFVESYDGDKLSYFNSQYGAVSYPFYLNYELEAGHTLNKIIYTPRTDSGNKWGSFDQFYVEVAAADAPENFIKVGEFSRGQGVHSPLTIMLANPVVNAKFVRFTITKGYQDRVSCAEMEFFEASSFKFDPSTVFADRMCTRLREGVTQKQINQIPNDGLRNLAMALFEGTYDTKYRLAEYRPYQHPSVMASRNKTSKYSLRDNVTGLYAKAGETMAVIVDKLYAGANLQMMVQDLNGGYNNHKYYSLFEGYNEITTEVGGLIYIINHTNDEIPLLIEEADGDALKLITDKTVKVHFAGAKVNGYFDISKNTEADWKGILENAAYQDIDVLGKYSHLTWRVEDFRTNSPEITRTIDNLDRLVTQQHQLMGLVKYGKRHNNRMHFCIDYKAASPNASDYRTVYNDGTYYAEPFCKPDRFAARLWGPAHEMGHCNQTRPGLKWAGTTEVTNNIFSLYNQTQFGQPCKLLVDNCTLKDENDQVVTGDYNNIYQAARLFVIEGKRAHCLPGVSSVVHEVKLVPFWQLKLYMMDVRGYEDFYADLFEFFRTNPSPSEQGANSGLDQLDFVRQVCRISGLNLLDFFEKWGFLTPVDATLNDYGSKSFKITQAQIDALKQEINAAGYQKAADNLHLIDESNMYDYK